MFRPAACPTAHSAVWRSCAHLSLIHILSCVLAMVVVFRRIGAFKSTHKVVLFSWNMLGKVAMVAIPSILQQSFVSVGNIILQSVINTFGASVIAGYSCLLYTSRCV